MGKLDEYIIGHCIRGSCICGKCDNSLSKKHQPNGHTSDVQFFKVALKGNLSDHDKEIMKNDLKDLIKGHRGIYADLDLFDGNEHNFVEIGGWIGDQSLALMLMGMGELLDLWKLTTPNKVAPEFTMETKMMLAEAGYVSIIGKNNWK